MSDKGVVFMKNSKKKYIAPTVSVTEIKSCDVILASDGLAEATFTGKSKKYGELFGIDVTD